MPVSRIDPLTDSRWTTFANAHPGASVFHSTPWLQALHRTYGFRPLVLTTAAPDCRLSNGVVLCEVDSWMTGRRLVSLPFSDHCQPLAERPSDLQEIFSTLLAQQHREGWKYIEIRPVQAVSLPSDSGPTPAPRFHASSDFCLHQLDLTPDVDRLFHSFHKSCVQRKIRRAEREGLHYEEGRSPLLLDQFYRLLVLTRRRHGIPPQPLKWFESLVACMGEKLKIRVVSRQNHPLAAIITLSHNRQMVYKYGASDAGFNNLGGMPYLFWTAIREARQRQFRCFDLGRSGVGNQGLITFKDRWGAGRVGLHYFRSSLSTRRASRGFSMRGAEYLFARLPNPLLIRAGTLLYRHMA
ncbi:MAG: lipid II:glycine glycyltransferase FemX [Acidobacteriota bacterium]